MAETPAAWKHALEYLRDAASLAALSFEALVSEAGLGHRYAKIEAGILEAIQWALEQGDIATLSECAGVFQRHQELRDKAQRGMSQLLAERAGMLPAASQQWLLNHLGLTVAGPSVEYANPADSPEVRQAATLLLYLFDQQTRNAELQEAFERFHTLCEGHFHLFLRGTVGSRTTFDSRLHETPESTAGELRLVRPWVEWYLPPNARIVIRGIVESERHEQEA